MAKDKSKKSVKKTRKKPLMGLRSEFKQVRWSKKNEMIKYSIAVLLCILIFALFFMLSDFIIAGIRSIMGVKQWKKNGM